MTDLVHVSRLSDAELTRAFRCRAMPFAALVRELHRCGLAQQVREHLPSELREHFDAPPSAITWIPAVWLERLLQAIERCVDETEMRAIARRSIDRRGFILMAKMARLAMARGPIDHHWVARVFVRALRRQVRGMSIEYAADGARGQFEIRYAHLQEVRATSFAYWQGLVEGVFGWVDVDLEISRPDIQRTLPSGVQGSFSIAPQTVV